MVDLGALVGELPLDALETINAPPFLEAANRRAQHYSRTVGRLTALGNSDGHVLAAVGKGYTAFPRRSAAALRRAIEHGHTAAHATAYTPGERRDYLRDWVRLTGIYYNPPAPQYEHGVTTCATGCA